MQSWIIVYYDKELHIEYTPLASVAREITLYVWMQFKRRENYLITTCRPPGSSVGF